MDERPVVDERDPASVVTAMIDGVLALVPTWPRWDGVPVPKDDRVYTPNKAIRRVTDHLLDHLAQIEARIAGAAEREDTWHASAVTTPADLAPFTPEDADEASSRLTRLRDVWSSRLGALSDAALDATPNGSWSVREISFHVAESLYYAEALGEIPSA